MKITFFVARVSLSVIVLAALVLVGCSTVRVQTDFDPGADFVSYKSFAWLPGPPRTTGNPRIDNPLLDKRIRNAVTRKLELQGYVATDVSSADMLVGYHISLEKKLKVTNVNDYYGYGHRGYRGWGHSMGTSRTTVSEYEMGTLIIDLVDRRRNELVWRGFGETRINRYPTPEKAEKKVKIVVGAILIKFPPH
jgi:hypothetical protein